MDPRISFITVIVRDLAASRAFYVDGLGWPVDFESPGDVVMITVGPRLVLSLWAESSAVDEVGTVARGEGAPPFTLAHNVATAGEVDRVFDAARAAGAAVIQEPVSREWGGYSGYVADPDGFRWEIAWNPGPVGQSVTPSSAPTPADVVRTFWERMAVRDWEGVRAVLSPEVVVDWVETAERFTGPDAVVRVNAEYPEGWSIEVLRIVADGDVVVAEVEVPHRDVGVFRVAALMTVAGGLITRSVEYWNHVGGAEPPAWRAGWAERIEAKRG